LTEDTATYSRRAIRYKLHKGDTVQRVADNFGVPPAMVRRWNHLKSDSLKGRSVVYVHLPVSPAAGGVELSSVSPSKSKHTKAVAADNRRTDAIVHHKVKQGETLYSIASTYRTTVDALKRDNSNVAILRPGMVLVIRP